MVANNLVLRFNISELAFLFSFHLGYAPKYALTEDEFYYNIPRTVLQEINLFTALICTVYLTLYLLCVCGTDSNVTLTCRIHKSSSSYYYTVTLIRMIAVKWFGIVKVNNLVYVSMNGEV